MKIERNHKAQTMVAAMVVFLAAGTLALGGDSTGLLKVVNVQVEGCDVTFDVLNSIGTPVAVTYTVRAYVGDVMYSVSGNAVLLEKKVHIFPSSFPGPVTAVASVTLE